MNFHEFLSIFHSLQSVISNSKNFSQMVEFCLGLYYGSGSKRRLDKLPFLLEKMIFYHC